MKSKRQKYPSQPQAELDLHGLTAAEAEWEVRDFLTDCQQKNLSVVRIIVGRGLNSPNGAVLPNVVKNLLRKMNVKFSPAKINEGGEGALIVRARDFEK